MVVAASALTLFLPALPVSHDEKERGLGTAARHNARSFPFAFLSGGVLYHLLTFLRVSL